MATSTFTLRGRRGTWRHPPSLCVAGVALHDIHLRFAWQPWHFATSTFVLRGKRGTYGTGYVSVWFTKVWLIFPVPTSFQIASLIIMIDSFNLVSPQARPPSLWHDRRGTCSQQPSFCMAGVALMALGWLWWLWSPVEALASFSCASLYTIFHTHKCVTHNSSHTTFLTSRSSTSFVFPSFPVPLQHLLLTIGRSVLFSGPLIRASFVVQSNTGRYSVQTLSCKVVLGSALRNICIANNIGKCFV